MLTYSVVTKGLHTREDLIEFVDNFGEMMTSPHSYGEWMLRGKTCTTHIDLYTFTGFYYRPADLIRRFMHIDHDPMVIAVSKRSSSYDPEFYRFIAFAVDHFKGFVDYDGEIVGQIYGNAVYYVNEDGSVPEDLEPVYEMPTQPIDFMKFLPTPENWS